MSATVRKVFDDALCLPAEERLSLVEELLSSLNLPTQREVDRLWAREAERRIGEIEAGKVRLVPGARVLARLRAKYRR